MSVVGGRGGLTKVDRKELEDYVGRLKYAAITETAGPVTNVTPGRRMRDKAITAPRFTAYSGLDPAGDAFIPSRHC